MQGTAKHQEHGMIFTITLDITLTKETIKEVNVTSTDITINKKTQEQLNNYLKGQTINTTKKITDQEMNNQLKLDQHVTATINHALHNAIRNHEQEQQGDPFQEAYQALADYQEGYKKPNHQDYGDCSCHSSK
ncbi:MAG: hypothetical protein Q7R56_00800 [Nanoarchaeota archaeon]|nr:hypothetical protein [Nanoarchaeota archaeon]